MSPVQKGILGLIIANVIWGFASPIFKWSLVNIPPFTLAFLRFFFGSILLMFFLKKRIDLPIKNRKDVMQLVAYALTGITFNIIFFFLGLQKTYAINGPIIASGQPILTFLFAILFLKERFKLKKFAGMLVGTIGIIVIVLEPILFTGVGGSVEGNMYLMIATIAAVVSTLIGRVIFQKYDPLSLMFWAFIISTASFLPLAVYEYVTIANLYQSINMQGIVGIAFGAIFSSAVAYGLFSWGLSKVPASEASLFAYVDPIAGTVLAYFMLHEPITIPFIAGAVFIFSGIFIAEGRIHYHPFNRLRVHHEARPCKECPPANS